VHYRFQQISFLSHSPTGPILMDHFKALSDALTSFFLLCKPHKGLPGLRRMVQENAELRQVEDITEELELCKRKALNQKATGRFAAWH
jgi:hypothetical protein